ncbi:MAG: hypothetical protein IPL75_01820 [Acidobacteria bacterium]|jgi:hypothetical protein|nr:hypothetical protein [Acidobacteriota bacterium]
MTMTRNAIGLVLAGAIAVGQFGVLQAQTPSPALGSVRLSRAVMADGKALPAGTYSLRRSADPVTPVVGQGPDHATWVEFLQGGQVKGRELASVVPSAEAKTVIKGRAPGANTSRVDLLKGGEYLRVWTNRGGSHYLIHLLVGS